jgi:hypothetical protein
VDVLLEKAEQEKDKFMYWLDWWGSVTG